jgi:C1A family cysteine protease
MSILKIIIFTISVLQINNHSIIDREYITKQKQIAKFDVFDYEEHPFKDWSIDDLRSILSQTPLREKEQKPKIFFEDESVIIKNDEDELPSEFDSRLKWPKCIHPLRNQNRCASCWAFGTITVFTDRLCIASNGQYDDILSIQDIVDCSTENKGCTLAALIKLGDI